MPPTRSRVRPPLLTVSGGRSTYRLTLSAPDNRQGEGHRYPRINPRPASPTPRLAPLNLPR